MLVNNWMFNSERENIFESKFCRLEVAPFDFIVFQSPKTDDLEGTFGLGLLA